MEFILNGEIKTSTYDKVVNLDRIEFSDATKKVDVYFEYPRIDGSTNISDSKAVNVKITDDLDKKGTKKTAMILNSTLFMIRTDEKMKNKNIIQFSSGGIMLRLITDRKNHPFRLRGNRNFKILISKKN